MSRKVYKASMLLFYLLMFLLAYKLSSLSYPPFL